MPQLLLNTNMIKQESKISHSQESNWGSPDWQRKVTTTTLSSAITEKSHNILNTHLQSLGTTLETFHFPETVQIFSNPTPITKSRINLQQKPTTIGLIRYKHSTCAKYVTSLTKRLMRSSRTPGVTLENLGLTSLPHFLD